MKLKCFFKAKEMVNKTKWQTAEWEKIFTSPIFDRDLISKIYKEFQKIFI